MFKKFIHVQTVEAFPAELKYAQENGIVPENIVYRGSVKLHGTNTGIVVNQDGTLLAQSRNRTITPGDDNVGFATFLSNYSVQDLFEDGVPDFKETFVVFGEWVGKGIMKGTACSLFPEKRFVAFAIGFEDGRLIEAPKMKAPFDNIQNVELVLNIKSDGSNYVDEIAKAIELTSKIDAECPWAKARGFVGHGEGVVWRPDGNYPRLWLKTKGLAHKAKTKIKRDGAEVAKEQKAISDLYLETDGPSRVQQGIDYLKEMGKPVDMKSIGEFIKWFNQDFSRECSPLVEVYSTLASTDQKVLRKGVSSLAIQEYRASLIR